MIERILLTGGSGFLGAMVIERLLQHKAKTGLGYEIRSLDLTPSHVEGISHNIGSVLDVTDLSRVMRGCDVVVHLAALLGVKRTEERRLDCLQINIQGTMNVLNSCALENVKKVVFASSSEVYGDQTKLPIAEDNPVNPKSIYAITKLAGEEFTRAYAERYGMQHTILRFFNAYGPGQVGQFVISRFVKAVSEDKSPLLIGTGEQVRAFCYGSDIAEGVVKSIFSERTDGHTINIGNDTEPVSMRELAERVIKIAGKDHLKPRLASDDESDRTPERDIQRRLPSLTKARELLGYEPSVTLDEGIRLVMDQEKIAEGWGRQQ
jgi:UDP-glucose 4-epimerase